MTSSRNRRRPIMPFYVEDYRNGVADLSAEQRGVYVSLLAIMWDSRAPLIDDTSAIARRISLNTRLVARVIGELVAIGKLVRCDGLIFNRRVMREVEKYDARDAAPSDNHDDARPQVINRPSAPRKASQKKPDAALKSELNGSQDANPVEIRKQKQRPSSPTPTHIQSIDNASNSQTPRCGSDFRSKDDLIELGGKGERPPSSKHAPPEARGLARLGISIAERTVTPHVSAELARKHGIKPASMRTFESRFWAWNDKKPSAERARDADAVFASWLATHLKRLSQVDCIRLLEPGSDLVLKATGLGERAKREGWYVELGEWCRRHGRIPIGKEIDALIGDAMRAATDALPAMPDLKPVKASRELAQALGALGSSILAKAAGNRVSA